MSEEEKSDLVEAYLLGKLSEEEVVLVRQFQEQDPDFRAELEHQRIYWEALGPSRTNVFRAMVSEGLGEQHPKGEVIKKRQHLRSSIAIAAGLAATLFALWWLFYPAPGSGEQLFADYFIPPPQTAVFRGETEDPIAGALYDLQKRIDSLYQDQRYEEAQEQLLAMGQQFPGNRSSDYYFLLGILQLCNDQPGAARSAFEQITVGFPTDRKWYTGLALLKMDSLAQARAMFGALSQTNNPYRQEAQVILEKLPE